MQHGLVKKNGGLSLKIDPRIEYEIYRTIPHDMMRHLPNLSVPAAFIGGADSDVVRRVRLAGMRPRFTFRKVPGGHLFPFEHPREAARSIAQALAEFEALLESLTFISTPSMFGFTSSARRYQWSAFSSSSSCR